MTKKDKADFALFCKLSTDTQLRNIHAAETLARRSAYAAIARAELQSRGMK